MRHSLVGSVLAVVLLIGVPAPAHAVDPAPTSLPALPGVEVEPNNTSATATPLVIGSRTRANQMPNTVPADVDYYSFTAAAGDRVFAHTITSGSGGSTDTVLDVIAPDGTTVIETDDQDGSLSGSSSSIAGTVLAAGGTYFLKVSNFSATVTNTIRPYDLFLTLRSGTATAESEPNDLPATASPIGSGDVSGTINPAADKDYFAVTLNAGDTLSASLDLDPERDAPDWNGRLGIAPLGDAGTVFPVNDPSTFDAIPSEALAWTVKTAGTYYVYVDEAAAGGAATDTYELSVNVIPAQQPSCRSYLATAPGAIADVSINTFDIPVADVARVDRVALDLDLTHTRMVDLDIGLRSPTGDEIEVSTDNGASVINTQNHMEILWDDFAAVPPTFVMSRAMMQQPEIATKLALFKGVPASGTWRLVLRDDTAGEPGTLTAATLILCPEPDPGGADTVFSADFEADDGGFTHSGTADEWERGTPATPLAANVAPLAACDQGTSCFKTDLDSTYNINSSQDLLSPPIDLTARTGAIRAIWKEWYQFESASFDHAVVSVEEDGGANARSLWTWTGATMAQTVGSPGVAVGNSTGWSRQSADISDYAGKVVRLRFHLDSDASVNFSGWAIDDVRVVQPTRTLTVTKDGTGSGDVASTPTGITCGATCSADFIENSLVILTPTPAANADFAGWAGACTGAGVCMVTMDAAKSVTATFTLKQRTLTVTKAGTGAGAVTSAPAGIDCGATCAFGFADGTAVTLTAVADAGSTFAGWSVDCSGVAAAAPVTMDAAKACTATFDLTATPTPTATASPGGGSGTPTPTATATASPTATPTATPPPTGPSIVKRKAKRKRGATLTVTCGSTACTVKATAKVTSKGKKIGKLKRAKPKSLAAGQTAKLKLKPGAQLKDKLKTAKKVKVKVRVTFTLPTGPVVKKATIRIR